MPWWINGDSQFQEAMSSSSKLQSKSYPTGSTGRVQLQAAIKMYGTDSHCRSSSFILYILWASIALFFIEFWDVLFSWFRAQQIK